MCLLSITPCISSSNEFRLGETLPLRLLPGHIRLDTPRHHNTSIALRDDTAIGIRDLYTTGSGVSAVRRRILAMLKGGIVEVAKAAVIAGFALSASTVVQAADGLFAPGQTSNRRSASNHGTGKTMRPNSTAEILGDTPCATT